MSTDINPNVPVTGTPDSVEMSSGEGAASFDELEALFLPTENRVKGAKKAAAKKEASELEPEASEDKQQGKTQDLRPDAQAKPSKEPAEKAEVDAKTEIDKNAKAEAKARRLLKAKLGDQDLEIDEDSDFFVKVDGQEVPVKAKELFENYSGKVAWDKRFNEVERMRRTTRGENQRIDQVKTEIKGIFSEQDPNIRLFKMAQLSGMDPIQFRKQFFDDTIKDIETYYAMSDDERKARDLEFENRYYKHQADAAHKTLTDQQAMQDLDKKVKGLLQHNGIGTDAFVSRYEELLTIPQGQKQALEAQGKMYKGKPVPEFIVETIQKDALWNEAESALESVKLNWSAEQKQQNLLQLVNDAYTHGIKPKDLPEVVSEIWGKGRAKKIVERTERERQEHYEGRTPVPTTNSSHQPMFFDEIL